MPGVVHQTKDWKPTPRGHDHRPIRNPFEKKEKYWGKLKAWKEREAARKRGEHPRLPGQVAVGGGHFHSAKPVRGSAVIPTKHPSKIPPPAKRPDDRQSGRAHPRVADEHHAFLKTPSKKPTKPDAPSVKTETGHNVVATNTRGASVFLKGATHDKN